MKRLAALTGIAIALAVTGAPAAQASAGDDVCQVFSVLKIRFGC